MRARRRAALVRVAAVVSGTVGGFIVLQLPIRHMETIAAAGLVHMFGATRAHVIPPTSIQVFPNVGSGFRAVITPSCSSVGSLIALACLAVLVPRSAGPSRWVAAGVSMGVVVAGNVLRIAGSLAVGFVAGRGSLVLFHDWVGSAFTFAYTLGGFILMLYLQLPRLRVDAP